MCAFRISPSLACLRIIPESITSPIKTRVECYEEELILDSVGALSCAPKGCKFHSLLRHKPGLPVWSRVRIRARVSHLMFLSHLSLFCPYSLFLKSIKTYPMLMIKKRLGQHSSSLVIVLRFLVYYLYPIPAHSLALKFQDNLALVQIIWVLGGSLQLRNYVCRKYSKSFSVLSIMCIKVRKLNEFVVIDTVSKNRFLLVCRWKTR